MAAGRRHGGGHAEYGVRAPAKVPRAVVVKLNATIREILNDKDFVEKHLAEQGMVPMKLSPEQFAQYIETQTRQTRKLVDLSGIKIE